MDSIVADDRLPGAGALPQGLRLRLMQLWAVFSLYWRTGLRAKRLWVAAVVALVPPALPVLATVISRVTGQYGGLPQPMNFFRNLVALLYLHVILYVLAMLYGLALVSDEVEGKTLVHIKLRPVPRSLVVVGKYLASWLIAAGLLVGSLTLTYGTVWLLHRHGGVWQEIARWDNLRWLVWDSLIFLLALSAYMSLFACVGAWMPHGERWAVVFCFGWESLITYLPARLKWVTLMYHVQTLFPHNVAVVKFFSLAGEPLSKTTCVLILVAVTAVFLALTVWNLRRREIR
ncbi:MAG: ABC transporter permease [Candidatus Sumerlaeia bacterium]|nr:ABC transporter permease [Candidatus Sumerlaeia bacterium]